MKHGDHGGDGGHGDTEHGAEGTEVERDASLNVRRSDIDRIDRTITALLAERMRVGRELGRLKRLTDQPVRSEVREAEVLTRVRAAAAGPLTPASAERIFLTIIEETAACQARDAQAEHCDA